ncbi:hypothetical protein HYQ46_007408 [Verticillium longisporum]|nr:hypothetical protein HYQ46_007408 [Verticillium longisporum]
MHTGVATGIVFGDAEEKADNVMTSASRRLHDEWVVPPLLDKCLPVVGSLGGFKGIILIGVRGVGGGGSPAGAS